MPDRIGVFLDRDGTLNVEVNYLRSPDELRIIDGAIEAVRKLNDAGLITCVISNQSGVARGLLTEADISLIHERLAAEFRSGGARFDRILYCPHHPSEGIPPYNVDCNCRKPKPGMLREAARHFDLDLRRCYIVGDSVVDIQAGNAVGTTTVLVKTGYGSKTTRTCAEHNIHVDFAAESVVDAVEMILDHVQRRTSVV